MGCPQFVLGGEAEKCQSNCRGAEARGGRLRFIDSDSRQVTMLATENHVIAGVRCAIHDSGPRDARTAVVFVHGNPGPLDDWEDLAPAIARFTRVVAMDMPGYGRSERPRGFDYTIAGYGRYLGAILDHLTIERAHLVLHDFGGAWGLRWGLDHPERFASLTMINCGVLENYRWHVYARIFQTPVLGEFFQLLSNARGMHRALNKTNPKPLPRSFIDRIMRYADWGHKRAVLKLYRASRNLAAAFPDIVNAPALKALPACVIFGAGDPFVQVEYAEKQPKYFPRAELHVLPGCGHWPFVDDPPAVLQPLEAFLRRQLSFQPDSLPPK
jgi:pimeloyl-ACP methyl ester carboxylesterase